MSLLLQALQKAAKNRDEKTGNSAVESNDGHNDDLSLEPLSEPQLDDQTDPVGERQRERESSPEDAAGVMRANEISSYSALDWARDHYMLTFLAGAALFAIFYGLYVYWQISNPGLFRSVPAPAAAPLQTTAAPGPAAIEPPPRIAGLPEGPAAAQSDSSEVLQPAGPTRVNSPQQAASADHGNKVGATAAAQPVVRPTRPAAPAAAARRSASRNRVTATTDSDGVEVIEIPAAPSVAVVPPEQPASTSQDIAVQAQDSAFSEIDPALLMAYQALQQGNYEKAGQLYSEVLSRAPDNIDAMLGLAAIAWKQGRTSVASQYYGRVLEIDPRNTHAQAGLIGILGNADPVAAETKLKQLIEREPSGFLYFTLGNLYAERSLWAQAQHAYFQAYQFQPDNSDYAFNLAVGLEHLGQKRLALDYYRKALDLSFRKGRANFDQALAIERVGQLSSRVE